MHIAGASEGALAGVTFVAKDLFDIAGYPTGGGNPDWAAYNPVPTRHAWAVHRHSTFMYLSSIEGTVWTVSWSGPDPVLLSSQLLK